MEISESLELFSLVCDIYCGCNSKFVVDEAAIKRANIGWTGPNFKANFLGKVERDVEAKELSVYELIRLSYNDEILDKLGGLVEIKVWHLFDRLEAQSNGEPGPLKVDTTAAVAYSVGNDGNLWTVRVNYCPVKKYWFAEANPVTRSREWTKGTRFLLNTA